MRKSNWVPAAVATGYGVAVALAGPAAWSGDWQFNPRIELGGQVDNNYHLQISGDKDSVHGGFADAQFQFRNAGQINDFKLTPGVHATKFSGQGGDDSTDPSVDFDFTHRGLSSLFGLVGAYSKETVVRTDRGDTTVAGGGLGNPTGGDSGYITLRDRRQLSTVAPSLSVDLTQRSHLLLDASYLKVDFDREIPGAYVGSTNWGSSVGYSHELSERSSFIVRGRYLRFEPNGAFSQVDSYGLEAEWRRHVTQLMDGYVRVGALRSSFSALGTAPAPASATNVVAGGGVNWNFQVSQLFLDATRTIDPNASGYSVVRDQLRLRLSKNMSPKTVVIVGARGYHDSATGTVAQYSERKYLVGTLDFQWRFERAWTLAAGYSYTHQKFQFDPTAAESNAGTISVVYEPNRRD